MLSTTLLQKLNTVEFFFLYILLGFYFSALNHIYMDFDTK